MKIFLPILAFILCASISPAAELPSEQTSRLLHTYGGFTDLQGEKTGFFHTFESTKSPTCHCEFNP